MLLLTLAGCGAGNDGRQKGTGYSVALPSGWSERTKEATKDSPIKADRVFVGVTRGGFTTTFNVIRERAPAGIQLADVASTFRRQLRGGLGATEFSQTVKRELAGEPAARYDYSSAQNKGRGRQLVAIHSGRVFTVTFSSAASTFPAQSRIFDHIVASWKWS